MGFVMRGLAALLLLIGGLFAAMPVAAAPPAAGSVSLVISEVFVPVQSARDAAMQWIEIHNPTGYSYPLRGLQIGNSKVKVPLNTSIILQPARNGVDSFAVIAPSADALRAQIGNTVREIQIIEAPDLFPFDPLNDAALLLTGSSLVIDQVNWGTPNPIWPNYNETMWTPGLAPLDNPRGSRPQSWGRTPPGRDTDAPRPGDWTLHDTLSPGGTVVPAAGQPALLGFWTDLSGALGGILLWVAFVSVGVIAYRLERQRGIRTYWQLLLLAPLGILFYAVMTIMSNRGDGLQISDAQRWWATVALILSALFCLVAMYIFRNVSRVLLGGK